MTDATDPLAVIVGLREHVTDCERRISALNEEAGRLMRQLDYERARRLAVERDRIKTAVTLRHIADELAGATAPTRE